jgi:molecular chaperone HtpG
VQPAERAQVGTTVTLFLQPAHERYLDRDRLQTIVRTYADFIGIPIYLNDDADPANAVVAPWHRTYPSDRERDLAYFEFWEKKFVAENSLHVFAVDERFEWEDITQPTGTSLGRVRGVLAITDRRVPDVSARGIVDIYISRMFIAAGNRDVLPPWAKFLQGVLECDELTPNAARDNVVRNAALAAVQHRLGELTVSELTALSRRKKSRFVDIMRWHSYHILAMSVQHEHEEFFRSVADLMPLESDPVPMTVAEYLETAPTRSDGSKVVYYITERGSANQFFLLANARSMRVFNCAEPFAERFLQRYARLWPDRVHLTRLDVAGSETIFEPLGEDERDRYTSLQAAYNMLFPDLRFMAKVSRFRPVDVPAVLTETRDGKSRREMQDAAENLTLPDYIRNLVKGFLQEEREPLTLHLNADNPTIRRLAQWPNLRDEVGRHALVSLYSNALMLLARALRVEDVEAMFVQYNQVIELMLSLAADRAEFERTLNARVSELDEIRRARADTSKDGRDPYVSCFVAMPYRDPRTDLIYQAVRAVLEDKPFYWRVIRADDSVEHPGLWENIKAKLVRSHCCVAILGADINPNVMIEIGRMEALERPVVLLRDSNAPELPADLKGMVYGELDAGAPDLHDAVREILNRQERLRGLSGDRYLSETVLKRVVDLSDRVSREISRRYETWQAFLEADNDQVAAFVSVHPTLIQAAKAALLASER